MTPLPGQMELTIDREQQLALKRRVRLGSTTAKAMLFVLDDHIGKRNADWALTYEELAAEIEVSTSTAYRVARELEQLGVIDRKTEGKRVRFSIRWGTLWALDEQQNGPQAILTDANPIRTGENAIRTNAKTFRTHENAIRTSENHTTYESAINSAPSAPSSAQGAVAEAPPELVVMVVECGVGRAGEAVAQALANGMTEAQIRDVVEHFADPDNAGRWKPGVLFDRLTRPGAFALPADAGWFGDLPEWLAGRRQMPAEASKDTPESRWGPELDRLTSEALLNLADRLPPRDRGFAIHAIQAGHATQRTEVRRLLLRQLAMDG